MKIVVSINEALFMGFTLFKVIYCFSMTHANVVRLNNYKIDAKTLDKFSLFFQTLDIIDKPFIFCRPIK